MAEEKPKQGWNDFILSKFSSKSDSHRYLTGLDEIKKHEELYKAPHQ